MQDLFSCSAHVLEGHYDSLVPLIDGQEKVPEFIHWISDGNYERNTIHDQLIDGKHTRISMFYVDNLLVLTARSEINFKLASSETIHFLNQTQNNDPILIAPPLKLERNIISKVVCEPYYNIICQLVEKTVVVGTMWEIYELPHLWTAFLKKNET